MNYYLLLLLYILWFAYTSYYSTRPLHVPWRSPFINLYLLLDNLLFTKLFSLDRALHFSLPVDSYKDHTKDGTCWAFFHHHLLLPGFSLPLLAERTGLSARMGVDPNTLFAASSTSLFYLPIIRLIILTLGGRVASAPVLRSLKTFGVIPGGVYEMVRQSPKVDRVYLRRGFVRMARRKKLTIAVGYMFDETTAYVPFDDDGDGGGGGGGGGGGKGRTFSRSLVDFLERYLHIGVCRWKGRWGVPFSPVPYPGRYVVGIGRVLAFPPSALLAARGGEEEEREVEVMMGRIEGEVSRLFGEMQGREGRRGDVRLEIRRLESRGVGRVEKAEKEKKEKVM